MTQIFENRRALAEFCDRRQGRKQLDEWIRLATNRPFRTDKGVDGRRRNLPSTREWFIKGVLRMHETDAFLNYKHNPEQFLVDDWRMTSHKELMRVTGLTEHALKACLLEFEEAGVVIRDSPYIPTLNRRMLSIKLNGARMLEILAQISDVKKRRAKGDDFTDEQVEEREFQREDIKSIDLSIEQLREIDEPMAEERTEDAAKNEAKIEVGTIPVPWAVDRPSTLRVNSDSVSRHSVLTISGVRSKSSQNDLDTALPSDGRKKRMIPKGLRDVIVMLGAHLFEGQKVTARHVKLLTRWYRSSSAEENISVKRLTEVLQFTRDRDDTFLEKQNLDSFCLFWPWIYKDIIRHKMQPYFDVKRMAATVNNASISNILVQTKIALTPDHLLDFPEYHNVFPEYVLGRFLYASALGRDMRPLIGRFGKELAQFFVDYPHYYAEALASFPVDEWFGDRRNLWRVQDSLEQFETDRERAHVLQSYWGEIGVEDVKDKPEGELATDA